MKPTQQIWTVNSLILVLIVVSSTGLSALAADVYVSLSPGLGYSAVDCGKNVSHPCNSIQTAVNLPTTRDGDVLWLLNNGVCREMNVTVDKSVTIAAYNGTITWQCSSADGNMTRALTASMCLNLTDIAFQDCYTEDMAGAVGIFSCVNGSSILERCSFSNCSCTTIRRSSNEVFAGAVYFDGNSLKIHNSTFRNCSVTSVSNGFGGAVVSYGHTEITSSLFTSCTVNASESVLEIAEVAGGAVFIQPLGLEAPYVRISHSTFSFNSIFGGLGAIQGSAVYVSGTGQVSIQDCMFKNNSIEAKPKDRQGKFCGGALYVSRGEDLNVTRTQFSWNTIFASNGARAEGAAANVHFVERVYLNNVTVVGNSLRGNGGHLTGAITVQNATLVSAIILQLRDNIVRSEEKTGFSFGRVSFYGGGGAYLCFVDRVVIADTMVEGNAIVLDTNHVHFSRGAGMAILFAKRLSVIDVTMRSNFAACFYDNSPEAAGGIAQGMGLFTFATKNISISGSLFYSHINPETYRSCSLKFEGGAVSLWKSDLIHVHNSQILSNVIHSGLETEGGGGFIQTADVVIFTNCTVTGNMAMSEHLDAYRKQPAARGGGLFVWSNVVFMSNVIFEDNVVSGQYSYYDEYETGGAALHLFASRNVILQGCLFMKNLATTHSDRSDITPSESSVSGAVINEYTVYFVAYDCQFTGNAVVASNNLVTQACGAAIHISVLGEGTVVIASSSFNYNSVMGNIRPNGNYTGTTVSAGAVSVFNREVTDSGHFMPNTTIILVDSSFCGNIVRGGDTGHDVFFDGGSALASALMIRNQAYVGIANCSFTRNINQGGAGKSGGMAGASVMAFACGNITISNTTLQDSSSDNSATKSALVGSGVLGSAFCAYHFHVVSMTSVNVEGCYGRGGDSFLSGGPSLGIVTFLYGHAVLLDNVIIHRNQLYGGNSKKWNAGSAQAIVMAINITMDTTVKDCKIFNNLVQGGSSEQSSGGDAVSTFYATSNLLFERCLISDNRIIGGKGRTNGGWGIGVVSFGSNSLNSAPTLTAIALEDCRIFSNTVHGGSSSNGVGGSAYGGIFVLATETAPLISLTRCIIVNNQATSEDGPRRYARNVEGGGLWICGSSEQYTIVALHDCIFQSNRAVSHGYGISRGGSIALRYSDVLMRNVTLENSVVQTYRGGMAGGGIYAYSCNMIMIDVSVEACRLYQAFFMGADFKVGGGGLYISDGSLLLRNSRFTSCTMMSLEVFHLGWMATVPVVQWFGGAIGLIDMKTVHIENCEFAHNNADQGGALDLAVMDNSLSVVKICNSTFLNNTATSAGGSITVDSVGNGTLQILLENCHFSKGIAERGGHFCLIAPGSSVTALNCVFTTGMATFGGAVWLQQPAGCLLVNTSLENNHASMGGGIVASDLALASPLCPDSSCPGYSNTASFGTVVASLNMHVFCNLPSQWPVNGGGIVVDGTLVDSYNQSVTGWLLGSSYLISQLTVDCPNHSYQVGEVVSDQGHVSFEAVVLDGVNGTQCNVTIALLAYGQAQSPTSSHLVQLVGCTESFYVNSEGQCEQQENSTSICRSGVCVIILVLALSVVVLLCIILAFLSARAYNRYRRLRNRRTALPLLMEKPNLSVLEILNDPDINVIPYDSLHIEAVIGQGGQGVVWKATCHDEDGTEMNVAVKETHMKNSSNVQSFLTEIKIASLLSHPNICPFYGIVVLDNDKLGMVSQYLEHGTLEDIVHEHGNQLTGKQRIDLLIDVATGLKYLHSQRVIHRDIKATNVLIDASFHAVLTDFGCSGVFMQEGKWLQTITGTPLNMAPEMLSKNKSNEKVDIYAMGILINEVVGGEVPFAGHSQLGLLEFMGLVANGQRPSIPGFVDAHLRSLIEECWHEDSDRRPSVDELLNRLQRLRKSANEWCHPEANTHSSSSYVRSTNDERVEAESPDIRLVTGERAGIFEMSMVSEL